MPLDRRSPTRRIFLFVNFLLFGSFVILTGPSRISTVAAYIGGGLLICLGIGGIISTIIQRHAKRSAGITREV
jgi:putative Mn2+ efflux pump MntP